MCIVLALRRAPAQKQRSALVAFRRLGRNTWRGRDGGWKGKVVWRMRLRSCSLAGLRAPKAETTSLDASSRISPQISPQISHGSPVKLVPVHCRSNKVCRRRQQGTLAGAESIDAKATGAEATGPGASRAQAAEAQAAKAQVPIKGLECSLACGDHRLRDHLCRLARGEHSSFARGDHPRCAALGD